MVLVHLLSALKRISTPPRGLSSPKTLFWRSTILSLFLFSDLGLAQANAFGSFGELRKFLMNEFGGAKKRIWIVTDFLSDGETVSSLYVAKYRGLDVAVLLGRAKARAYMSRLRFLKRQNIPAALRPNTFPLNDPTLVLVDDKLFRIDGEINFLDQDRRFRAVLAERPDYEAFQAAFLKSRKNPETAVAPPVPLVGKPRHNSSRFTKTTNGQSGAYNYDRHPQPRAAPPGLPRSLPRQTVYQKRGKMGQDAKALAKDQRKRYRQSRQTILNPITAREPVIWSPRSPESF